MYPFSCLDGMGGMSCVGKLLWSECSHLWGWLVMIVGVPASQPSEVRMVFCMESLYVPVGRIQSSAPIFHHPLMPLQPFHRSDCTVSM